MIKYAKIINKDTGVCEIGIGNNSDFYKSIGMIELDVEQSEKDNLWYLSNKCPHYTETELKQKEQDSIKNLYISKKEMLLFLFYDKNITIDQLKSNIINQEELIELECETKYSRDNILIQRIGNLFGYSSKDLDCLFKYKKIPKTY